MKKTKIYMLNIVFISLISALFIISSCTKKDQYNETTTTTECPWISPLPPDFCPGGKIIFDKCIPRCEPNKNTTTTTLPKELIEIITDRDVYTQYGKDVEIKMKNNGLNTVTLTAQNRCAKFFEVINIKTGKSISLYNKNAICTQAIKEITINPGETKIIGYWDKVDNEKSYCNYEICRSEKVDMGKYKIIVKDASKIIDVIVYTY